ncbi:RNA ligase/cyclic nucleotide phosphodiesterase [Penicillium taxi]|uniref:RNA ligase/cyclic nucleotide phosphodiesterase n=1 Tax=Penicillium taxi TaxID=168475 RepID=UPI002544FAD4|nr:RNA ligase/cyclic nucleotide phosphodiesterase [Penicillium taxi]KAJ5898763.1 RNA ligase/cyclic nucleotide phosphodiesterase [Penicillium taxi]
MSATNTLNPTERPAYPDGVALKFSLEGDIRRYPGNTTVCHLPTDCSLQPGLRTLYENLKSHTSIGKGIRLVPQESWHMTLLDCYREIECDNDGWPEGMTKKSIPEYTAELSRTLRKLGPELEREGLAPPYRMRATGFNSGQIALGLRVEGATPEEERRMRRLRDRLADAVGFRAPNHEYYGFHVTIAYFLCWVEGEFKGELDKVLEEQRPAISLEFELGSVEFCTFEDMCAYPREFYLTGQKS